MCCHKAWFINITKNTSRYDVITAADYEFGTQHLNGSWTGMIGMVINKVCPPEVYIVVF